MEQFKMPKYSSQDKKKINFLTRTAMALGIMAGGLGHEAQGEQPTIPSGKMTEGGALVIRDGQYFHVSAKEGARPATAEEIKKYEVQEETRKDFAEKDGEDSKSFAEKTPVKNQPLRTVHIDGYSDKVNLGPEGGMVKTEKERRLGTKLSPEEVKEIHPDYNPDIDDKPFVGVAETSGIRTSIKRDLEKVSPEESARLNAELDNLRKEALEVAERASDHPATERTKPRN